MIFFILILANAILFYKSDLNNLTKVILLMQIMDLKLINLILTILFIFMHQIN